MDNEHELTEKRNVTKTKKKQEKKKCVEYTLALSRFCNSKISLNQGPFTIFLAWNL